MHRRDLANIAKIVKRLDPGIAPDVARAFADGLDAEYGNFNREKFLEMAMPEGRAVPR